MLHCRLIAVGRILQPSTENMAPAQTQHRHHSPSGGSMSGTSMVSAQSMDRSVASVDGTITTKSEPTAMIVRPLASGTVHTDGVVRPPRPDTALGPLQEQDERDTIWLVRVAQKIAGVFVGLSSAAFVVFYQWVVEPAAPGSFAVRMFAKAANGGW